MVRKKHRDIYDLECRKIFRNCSKEELFRFGIYKISNPDTPTIYIGSTGSPFRLRWNNHSHFLINGNHDNVHLQRSFNKYKSQWTFSIIETITDVLLLLNREKFWISQYNIRELFNQRAVADNRFIYSAELRAVISQKVSAALKGIIPKNLESLRKAARIPIVEYENGKKVKEYESCKKAGEILNIDYRLIHNVIKGKVKQVRKYPFKTWKYKNTNGKKETSRCV